MKINILETYGRKFYIFRWMLILFTGTLIFSLIATLYLARLLIIHGADLKIELNLNIFLEFTKYLAGIVLGGNVFYLVANVGQKKIKNGNGVYDNGEGKEKMKGILESISRILVCICILMILFFVAHYVLDIFQIRKYQPEYDPNQVEELMRKIRGLKQDNISTTKALRNKEIYAEQLESELKHQNGRIRALSRIVIETMETTENVTGEATEIVENSSWYIIEEFPDERLELTLNTDDRTYDLKRIRKPVRYEASEIKPGEFVVVSDPPVPIGEFKVEFLDQKKGNKNFKLQGGGSSDKEFNTTFMLGINYKDIAGGIQKVEGMKNPYFYIMYEKSIF